jgi:probable phosphoglycerate mutase
VEIVLIRHGEPDWEPRGFAVDDPELTPRGRAQAERAAQILTGESFDHLYVSPLLRARETAQPIAKRLGLEPQVLPWLRELGLPALQGRPAQEVRRYFADARARDLEHWWDGLPGGESFRHFYERVSAGVESLLLGQCRLTLHEDAGHRLWRLPETSLRILIVAHEGTNAVILSHLLGTEPVPWAPLRFSSAWAGLARVRTASIATGAIWVLESFNRVHHLDGLV